MKAQASTTSHGSSSSGSTFHAYYELTKPRVVALIVFTAIVGMFLSVDGMVLRSIKHWVRIGTRLGPRA